MAGIEKIPEFTNKIVVITGASRGIGAATAIEFSRQGAKGLVLVSTGKNYQQIEDVAHRVETHGSKALIFSGDLSDPEASQAVISATKVEFGQVNVVVNNAGVTRDSDILRATVEDWDIVMATNLRPAFLLSKYAFRAFPKTEKGLDGVVVNVASIVGIVGNSGQENYAAAKSGLIGLTMSLAHNLGRRGVRVNAVAPGFIDTDMTQAWYPKNKDILEATVALTTLGRLGNVQDIANAITFVASSRASFITGQTLIVDGGLGGKLHAIPEVMRLRREVAKLLSTPDRIRTGDFRDESPMS